MATPKQKTTEENLPATQAAAGTPALPTDLADDAELAAMAGAGNENVTRNDLATPFLLLLQSNSPECKKTDSRHIPGAEEGMFLHSLTKRFYDGKNGLEVIDCYFEPLLLRWKPRDSSGGGGGFKGVVDTSDKALMATLKPGAKRELTRVFQNGDEAVETNQHYLLVRPMGSSEPYEAVVLGLSSTQLKKSRALNALISVERVQTAPGQTVQAPRFACRYKLTHMMETKDANTFWGVQFEKLGRVNKAELDQAKALWKVISSGERRNRPTQEDLDRADASAPTNPGQAGVGEDTIPY